MYNPVTCKPEVYQQAVLPFGSIASVTAFLRCAVAIWQVGSRMLKLSWTSYFDDFLSLATAGLEPHRMCISTFLHLLGWELSNDKLVPYSECCKVLCVELTLTKTPAGCFEVRNTESRVLELRESMMQALETNSLSRVEGERLRGRLQFASNQLFGRRFRNCLRELNFHVARGMKTVSAELAASLRLMCHLLALNSPRSVSVAHVQWSHLFVDASFDPEVFSGIGGVLFDSSGTCTGCFSERDDTTLLQSLMKPEQQTAILELEGLAVAAALGVFREK